MGETGILYQQLMAGLQAGLLLAMGLATATSRLAPAVRACSVIALASLFFNALVQSPYRPLLGPDGTPLRWALVGFGDCAAAFAWVAALALFDDRRIRPWHFMPVVILAIGSGAQTAMTGEVDKAVWRITNLFIVVLVLHLLFVIARGRAGDLVETRRRLRRPLVWACVIMAVAHVADQATTLPEWLGPESWQWHTVSFLGLAGFSAFVAVLLQLRRSLLEVPPVRTPPDRDDKIVALNRLMGEGQAWRREGVSIGALARDLGVPEHRLRRLINGTLGHRNFRAFVNAYRIDEAKRRLADPADKATVAEIAFDLGYSSLSTFNRTFKEAAGVTPSDWRRETADQK